MDKKTAFEILEVNGQGLNIKFADNELCFIGRACKDLSCGESLFTKTMDEYKILKIYSYNREFETISECMSCALVVKAVNNEVGLYTVAQKLAGQLLFAEK